MSRVQLTAMVVGGMVGAAIVVASVDIWLFHFLILRGVKQAAFINTVVTFAKVIPIMVFIVILLFVFKYGTPHLNMQSAAHEGGLIQQVRATMSVAGAGLSRGRGGGHDTTWPIIRDGVEF
ncbi:hypothetical protein [Paraburkholderia hiiakae]|nr:hypothetical protein [Paraburkholderia hiiakae]